MRRIYTVLFACTMFSPVVAVADDIPVTSEIDSAVVYTDRADVTRTAKVQIPAGEHVLVFEGLPANFLTDSLRANGSSTANVTFGALSHKAVASAELIAPQEKTLSDEIIKLEDAKKIMRADKLALQKAREFLDALGENAAQRENEDIERVDLNPENWSAVADSLTSKLAENMKAALAIDIKIRDVDAQVGKLRTELNQLRTGQKQSYEVRIPIESDAATTLSVDLSYQLRGAGWRPIYDARLSTKEAALELVQYGSVWQRTGEDWTDVDLTLSTAQPSRGTSSPKINPHWVSIYEEQVLRKTIGRATNVSALYADAVEERNEEDMELALRESGVPAAAAPRLEAKAYTAQINTEGYVAAYNITGPATVKADGTQSKHLIGSFDTQSALEVQVKPQFGTSAYLVAKTTLKGDAPILPGQVSLFRDGGFIGRGYVPMLRPDDEVELGFGIDDNVTVARNTIKDERSEAGIISKDTVLERRYTTEIKNLHKEPVKITVLENTPVSKDERISVVILKDATTGGYEKDVDDLKGVLKWSKELAAGEAYKVNLGWSVSWPKDEELSGLR